MSSRHGRSCHRGRGRHAQAAQAAAMAAAEADHTRQQLLDAALKTAPKHTYSSDDEDDEEFSEFRKQAAQLAEQVKTGSVLPEGLEPGKFATALQQLQQHLSISQEVASDVLLATAEQHWRDYDMWLDEAQVFLACRHETDIEADKMREAMEASIRERDQQRQQEEQSRPELTNLSEERLRKKFAGSAVLQQLCSAVPGAVLFCDQPPLFELTKCQLVALLRLEERCGRWWPGQGTLNYFRTFAEKCMSELQTGNASRGSSTHIAVMETGSADPQVPQQSKQQDHQRLILHGQHQQQQQLAAATRGQEANIHHLCTPSPQQQQPQQQQCQCLGSSVRLPPADGSINMAAGAINNVRDCTAAGGSYMSAGSAAPSAAAAAAAGCADDERRCSKRKRQAPERYRSPSCQASPQQMARGRAGSTPPPAAVKPCCSSEPQAKQARRAIGADQGSRAASEPVAAVAAAAPLARPAADCATSSAAAAQGYARTGSVSVAPEAAGAGRTPTLSAGAGCAAQEALQLQLLQLHQAAQQTTGGSESGLVSRCYKATVVQRLSQLLAEECNALKSMIYSFPSVAGAVPAIFKDQEMMAAATAEDDDDSSSDVEILAEVQGAVPAAAADLSTDGQVNGHTSVAVAVAPPVAGSPPDSPPPRLSDHQQQLSAAANYQRSPSVEIVSD